jgi:predicted nucleic acid-binding protein
VIYLDTSAILKLLVLEPETPILLEHLARQADQSLITSALSTVETARALSALGAASRAAEAVSGAEQITLGPYVTIPTIALTSDVLDLARVLPPAVLRSLDAIHVATAKLVETELDHLITYDRRMAAAADSAGLRVVAPA